MADAGPSVARELTPKQLAEQWKRQGGLDALRKQLLQDFLASPDRDQFLASLDTLLPTLLASSTTLARLPRKDRPAAVLRTLQQRAALREPLGRVEGELRSGKGKGKRVERELRKCLCEVKGVPFVEDEDEDEETRAELKPEKRVKAEEAAESVPNSPQAFAMPASTSQPIPRPAPASFATSLPPAQPAETATLPGSLAASFEGQQSPARAPPVAQDAPAVAQSAVESSLDPGGRDVEMADVTTPAPDAPDSTPAS